MPFLATIGVAVPAGWQLLDADLHTDGKHLRPLRTTVDIGEAQVSVEVDRGIVALGDKVKVTLVGTAPANTTLDLDVRVQRVEDAWGSRVAGLPVQIDRERVHVDAAPGGGEAGRDA